MNDIATLIEKAAWDLEITGSDLQAAEKELTYLQACARAVEDLMSMDATDETIAMFFKRDAKKLLKLKVTK